MLFASGYGKEDLSMLIVQTVFYEIVTKSGN